MHHIESDAIWGIEMQLLPECIGHTVAELLKWMHKLVTSIPVIPLPVFKNKRFTDVFSYPVYAEEQIIGIFLYAYNSRVHYYEMKLLLWQLS